MKFPKHIAILRILGFHSFAVLAASLLLVACSHSIRSAQAPAPEVGQRRTRLNVAEVIRIARHAGVRKGYRLSDYEQPEVHYEFTVEDKTWFVFFQGKLMAPGNYFAVFVDDLTGKTYVLRED